MLVLFSVAQIALQWELACNYNCIFIKEQLSLEASRVMISWRVGIYVADLSYLIALMLSYYCKAKDIGC